jgi:hypothetical protein
MEAVVAVAEPANKAVWADLQRAQTTALFRDQTAQT